MKMERELRFGIMCYGKTFQKWQAIVVEKLLDNNYKVICIDQKKNNL